jgi:triosephosphate isomerase
MYGDTDAVINTKTKLLLSKNIRPVLCIGETLEQRQVGQTNQIINAQFAAALVDVSDLTQVDVAYEPLRAIGTGLVPTNEEIEAVHTQIRSLLGNTQSRILYGGSSNDQNASTFITIPNVDGFLVG